MSYIPRKYGVATTVTFPLIDRGTQDFETTPVTFQNSDSQISKDAGAFVNTGVTPAHIGRGLYIQSLSATEMEAAQIAVQIIDITATKLWEDQSIIIDTYGNPSAQHAFDLDADAIEFGSAVTGTLTTTAMSTNLSETTDNHYVGRSIIWRSGNLAKQATDCLSYDGTNKILYFSDVTDVPVNGDVFQIN